MCSYPVVRPAPSTRSLSILQCCARLAAPIVVAATAACADPPVTTQVQAHFNRIGVVSVAATEFTQRRVGSGELDDQRSVRDISAWGVDRAYEEQLAAAVPQVLGVSAVTVADAAAALRPLNDPATPYVQPTFWAYRADPIAARIRDYCARTQLDALLVAARSSDDDVLGGTYHPNTGAGLYVHGDRRLLHLSATLTLIACDTGMPLETHHLVSGQSFPASHGYPVREVGADMAGKFTAPAGAGEDSGARQALIALPAHAWADTLRGMVYDGGPVVFGRALLPNS